MFFSNFIVSFKRSVTEPDFILGVACFMIIGLGGGLLTWFITETKDKRQESNPFPLTLGIAILSGGIGDPDVAYGAMVNSSPSPLPSLPDSSTASDSKSVSSAALLVDRTACAFLKDQKLAGKDTITEQALLDRFRSYDQSDFERFQRINQFIAAVPCNPAAYKALAELYLQRNDLYAAEGALSKSLSLPPTASNNVTLAQMLARKQKWAEYLSVSDAASRMGLMSQILAGQGKWKELLIFTDNLPAGSDFDKSRLYRVSAFVHLNQLDKAFAAAQPSSSQEWSGSPFWQGRIWILQHKEEAALARANSLLSAESFNDQRDGYLLYCEVLMAAGRFEDALRQLNARTKHNVPEEFGAQLVCCKMWLLNKLGRYKECLDTSASVSSSSLNEFAAPFYARRAECLAQQGSLEAATKDVAMALKIYPSSPEVLEAARLVAKKKHDLVRVAQLEQLLKCAKNIVVVPNEY